MRITILAHAEPGADETFNDSVGQVAAGLRKGSHRVSILGVHCEIGKLISGMKRRQPDLIFNLTSHEPVAGPSSIALVGLLDLLGLPYTGNGPGEYYIQQDSTVANALLAGDGAAEIAPRRMVRHELSGNGFHKPPPVKECQHITLGLLGNDEPQPLSPITAVDHRLNIGVNGCSSGPSPDANLSLDVRDQICQMSQLAYQALRVRDYGLIDIHVTGPEALRLVGVRTECDLGQSGEYARSAAAAGIDYNTLVNRIAELAIERAGQRPLVRLI